MRKPQFISPSAFMLWQKDREEFAIRYLCDYKPPRTAQQLAAAVGSAFDAYVKSNLHASLFGLGNDARFEFTTIFESQVEEQNRDFAKQAGSYCFENYIESGAYADLFTLMINAKKAPRFEFQVNKIIGGIPLIGKPDCQFITNADINIILDWKVRGYCSKHSVSPTKNYALCRDGLDWLKQSKSHGQSHKSYKPFDFKGLMIHEGWMEDSNREWATQLAIYGWVLEENVENTVFCIDELVCKSRSDRDLKPLLRIANHKSRIGPGFQEKLFHDLKQFWNSIESEHLIPELDKEASNKWFIEIQKKAFVLSSENAWYNDACRWRYGR